MDGYNSRLTPLQRHPEPCVAVILGSKGLLSLLIRILITQILDMNTMFVPIRRCKELHVPEGCSNSLSHQLKGLQEPEQGSCLPDP